jgi:LPXTG-motif cell wall-anchored protein
MKNKALRFAAAASIIGAAAIIPATSAHAVEAYGTTAPANGGTADPNSGGQGSLPTTGSDAMGMTLIGGGLAAGGVVLVAANRRRRAAAL